MRLLLVHSFFLAVCIAHTSLTIYRPHVQQSYGTVTATSAPYTSSDDVILSPPPLPNPRPPTSFVVQLQTGAVPGLSIHQQGSFFGFSIELSVATQVFGLNSSSLQVPFLNLMANIRERAGSVHVRVDGNTQDYATPIDSAPDGSALEKYCGVSFNPTITPPLIFTPEIIKTMAQISSLIGVLWYLNIPFNDTQNWRLQVAEDGETILGDYLVGLQAGSEPDLYSRRGHRSSVYGPNDYKKEFGQLIEAIGADSNISDKDLLIGPNLAGVWQPEDVWGTGFVTDFSQSLAALAVERYPTDNCYAQYGISTPRTAQEMLPSFLTHKSGQRIVSEFLGSTAYAQIEGLPFLMLETNTASCGGFPGLSDSFTAALWAIDYGLQMAYVNFTRAMFHVGGQGNYYNPFTPPVTNQSMFHPWTIGPVYYSSLFVAEALGSSNQSQVLDLQMNSDNEFTPGYAIYENGQPTRVALINFVDDNSGASDYTASISINGTVPSHVRVKYLSASSVTQKYNITWAGQTFGDVFSSDGRPVGVVDVQTVNCNQTNNVCNVKVPAPGAALVFLSDQAPAELDQGPRMTFPTIAMTKFHNTATADRAALASTSQGGGIDGVFRLEHGLPSVSALIAISTFVCLESLLSYAVTGNSPLGLVLDMTKNAR